MNIRNILNTCVLIFMVLCLGISIVSCKDNLPDDRTNNENKGNISEDVVEACRLISERIKEDNLPSNILGIDENISQYMGLLTDNGAFSDIDYEDQSSDWMPKTHLDRLKEMSQAYVSESSTYLGCEELYSYIIKALTYWNEVHPVCDNWYHNQISSPQAMGEILILLRYGTQRVPEDLEKSILQYWENTGGDPVDQSGANETDIALHWLYRGCLQEDKDVLEKALFHTFRVLDPVSANNLGLQFDMSFFQHGPQLYIGGYGTVMINGVTKVATYVADTNYGMTQNQLYSLYRFVNETYMGSIRGNMQFYNVMGRSVSRPGALNSKGFADVLEQMMSIDPEHKSEYEKRITIIKNNDYTGIQRRLNHYYVSDYMALEDERFSACVRMSSNRTRRCENGNDENLRGYFMSDGSTVVALDGDEYYDVFPAWNWSRIPGVTNPYKDPEVFPVAAAWGELGESDFAGGLTDGNNGLAALKAVYKTHDLDMNANKSYFFIDNKIVCLGSGITSTFGDAINTTIESNLHKGIVFYSQNGSVKSLSGSKTVSGTNIEWVWHRNIGYFIVGKNSKVTVKLKKQSGSWFDINKTKDDANVSKDVFTVWFDHGKKPSNVNYSYMIVPDITQSAMVDYPSDVEVLCNSEIVHAVMSNNNKLFQLVFFNRGSMESTTSDLSIKVDNPCALMLQKISDNQFKLYYSDPTHKISSLNVEIIYKGKGTTVSLKDLSNDNVYKGRTHETLISF